jgi:thymidylate kinase
LNNIGIVVAVLGPDGAGKSSVINGTLNNLAVKFREVKKLHWRPGVLPQLSALLGRSKSENDFIVANPHSPKERSRLSSFLRWTYYSSDYIIGYYFKILPMKIRTTAVIMDRYYYDIIVDPVRYGFNLPLWVVKSILPLIPKPDLTIYLDNNPEELYKRKQELPVHELKRQVKAWREVIPKLPNPRIVTTDKPIEDVVHEITKLVLEKRAEMTARTLKIDPTESRYLWKSDMTDYIALPSKKNCRWIIPTNSKLARKAWDLYRPYSLRGKLFKASMRLLSSSGGLRKMKSRKISLK